jgi:sensor histidine kinase YesM
MLLQPLVENAVRHGVARSPQAGIIAIGARRLDGGLEISVSDNGQGLAAETAHSPTGIGLRNTRERLEKLYGARHQFMVANRDPAGVEVRIRLPCHRSSSRVVEARKPT